MVRTPSEKSQLATEFLAHVESETLSLPAVLDRIETVTTSPQLTREILDEAETRGIVQRKGGEVQFVGTQSTVNFDQQVVTHEGDYSCQRCGASLKCGYFIQFDAGDLGPFGPSCVKKVTGRE